MPEFEPILTARWGEDAPVGYDRYVATGGYASLRKALGMTPGAIVEEVKASSLTLAGVGSLPPAGRKTDAAAGGGEAHGPMGEGPARA